MLRIGTIGGPGAAQASRPDRGRGGAALPALVGSTTGRASGGSRAGAGSAAIGGARPLAGFLAQVIVSADPTLRPSRAQRTREAAARYAAAARLGVA